MAPLAPAQFVQDAFNTPRDAYQDEARDSQCFERLAEIGDLALGFKLTASPPHRSFVTEIEIHSWAHFAGLAVGDELLAVNGRSLSVITAKDLGFLMRRIRPLKLFFAHQDPSASFFCVASSPSGTSGAPTPLSSSLPCSPSSPLYSRPTSAGSGRAAAVSRKVRAPGPGSLNCTSALCQQHNGSAMPPQQPRPVSPFCTSPSPPQHARHPRPWRPGAQGRLFGSAPRASKQSQGRSYESSAEAAASAFVLERQQALVSERIAGLCQELRGMAMQLTPSAQKPIVENSSIESPGASSQARAPAKSCTQVWQDMLAPHEAPPLNNVGPKDILSSTQLVAKSCTQVWSEMLSPQEEDVQAKGSSSQTRVAAKSCTEVWSDMLAPNMEAASGKPGDMDRASSSQRPATAAKSCTEVWSDMLAPTESAASKKRSKEPVVPANGAPQVWEELLAPKEETAPRRRLSLEEVWELDLKKPKLRKDTATKKASPNQSEEAQKASHPSDEKLLTDSQLQDGSQVPRRRLSLEEVWELDLFSPNNNKTAAQRKSSKESAAVEKEKAFLLQEKANSSKESTSQARAAAKSCTEVWSEMLTAEPEPNYAMSKETATSKETAVPASASRPHMQKGCTQVWQEMLSPT